MNHRIKGQKRPSNRDSNVPGLPSGPAQQRKVPSSLEQSRKGDSREGSCSRFLSSKGLESCICVFSKLGDEIEKMGKKKIRKEISIWNAQLDLGFGLFPSALGGGP